jgi:D-alanine-D-alanine ligase
MKLILCLSDNILISFQGDAMEIRLLYNLRSEYPRNRLSGIPSDIDADWDTPDTIFRLRSCLEKIGFDVVEILCDHSVVERLTSSNSLVFNICEMVGGSYREALIPSLCEILRIPYVFSSPDVMVKTLDKNMCNLIAQQVGINVPNWLYLRDLELESIKSLNQLSEYPYIIKPAFEGSGMGISDLAVVYSHPELIKRTEYTMLNYGQPALIQRYIDGLELTVGVLGEGEITEVLAPVEIMLFNSKVYGYEQKENSQIQAAYSINTDKLINKEIEISAKKIYQALGCRDAARIDFRFDILDEKLYFIEVNPLPHLHPDVGDFCRSAYGSGYQYEDLIRKICDYAVRRL